MVAPLVGAWIEIVLNSPIFSRSPVAPLVGAWIEILPEETEETALLVAPLVGAWIEISFLHPDIRHGRRRSPRGSVD